MKSKQLANVLIKCLGLSMCLYSIPGFLYSLVAFSNYLFAFAQPSRVHDEIFYQMYMPAVAEVVREVVEVAVGLFAIIKSRKIADYLFKNEDE